MVNEPSVFELSRFDCIFVIICFKRFLGDGDLGQRLLRYSLNLNSFDYECHERELNTFGRLSAIFFLKRDNFCDFLFAFLHSKPRLKKKILTELPPLKVYPFPLNLDVKFSLARLNPLLARRDYVPEELMLSPSRLPRRLSASALAQCLSFQRYA